MLLPWCLFIRSRQIGVAAQVIAVLDAANRLNVVQLPHEEARPRCGAVGWRTLAGRPRPHRSPPCSRRCRATSGRPAGRQDVSTWSLVFHTIPLDGREMRSHHAALSVFRGRSRTLYICGVKEAEEATP